MKMVSKDLIELSKNSSYPIDNVIITSDYALSSHSREKEYLDISKEERNELLRNLSFNIKTDALILASSNENNKLVKFTNSDELPEYDLIRDEVKVYNNEDAVRRMKQLHFINDIINGVKSNEIDISTNFEIPNYIVSGEDFYVAYYNDRVETYIIDIRKNNSKTLDEINYVLNNNEEKSYESKR